MDRYVGSNRSYLSVDLIFKLCKLMGHFETANIGLLATIGKVYCLSEIICSSSVAKEAHLFVFAHRVF